MYSEAGWARPTTATDKGLFFSSSRHSHLSCASHALHACAVTWIQISFCRLSETAEAIWLLHSSDVRINNQLDKYHFGVKLRSLLSPACWQFFSPLLRTPLCAITTKFIWNDSSSLRETEIWAASPTKRAPWQTEAEKEGGEESTCKCTHLETVPSRTNSLESERIYSSGRLISSPGITVKTSIYPKANTWSRGAHALTEVVHSDTTQHFFVASWAITQFQMCLCGLNVFHVFN